MHQKSKLSPHRKKMNKKNYSRFKEKKRTLKNKQKRLPNRNLNNHKSQKNKRLSKIQSSKTQIYMKRNMKLVCIMLNKDFKDLSLYIGYNCLSYSQAIYGSFERFVAILTEQHGGKWPFWISPK